MVNEPIFQQRRQRLYQCLGDDAVAIVVGNTAKTRSKNIRYHFRPDNNLFYLTGITEPDVVAVFRPGHQQPYSLFLRENDAAAETSFGKRQGLTGACQYLGADQAFAITELSQKLPSLFAQRSKIYYLDEQNQLSDKLLQLVNQQRQTSAFDQQKIYPSLHALAPIVFDWRVIKSAEEIALIRHAVNASVDAHLAVMQHLKPGVNEAELAGLFQYTISQHGCQEVSYPSIVAAGDNAMCLHYEDNNGECLAGDLLLIDAGAEYQYYCADITRTYPISGQFTRAQKTLYRLVLAALDEAIAQIKPGFAWDQIYQVCMRRLATGLLELGILSGELEQIMQTHAHKLFTVHKTGHWLGMDVHDVGSYHDANGQWRPLQAGMVFTIEPGLYIAHDCELVAEQWRGIAIRIEDDILVTDTGYENLSAALPRTVEQIEATMQAKKLLT